MTECKLCRKSVALRDSHAIPAFVVRWIKETSATPYLRSAVSPNLRKQDIGTIKLLCAECELVFSKVEGAFAERIFMPYVAEVLDSAGIGRLNRTFDYQDWLLRFAISLQWRVLATRPDRVEHDHLLDEVEVIWRDFLLGKRGDSGPWETHMVFLSSLGGALISGNQPLGKRVNMYLLHSVDATTVASDNGRNLGIYSKAGPFAFYTPVKPRTLKGNTPSKLHMRGQISVGQSLKNGWLGQFIFITRPNEAYREISARQAGKIAQDSLENPARVLNSMSFHLLDVDSKLAKKGVT